MLIRMVLTGAVFTLTTAAALAYGMYDGTYRGKLIGIGNDPRADGREVSRPCTATTRRRSWAQRSWRSGPDL